jgi:hypothetical protein
MRWPLLALVLLACSPAPAEEAEAKPTNKDALELPPLDSDAADAVAKALARVDPQMRGVMAATALAELEKGRLPPSFVQGLEAISQAPPDMRSTLLTRSLAESMAMLNHLCGNGLELMRSLAEMSPAQRGEAVFDGCKMNDLGLVKREEIASRDAIMLLMGHLAFDHLSRGGALHPGERAAIEALVGASPIP